MSVKTVALCVVGLIGCTQVSDRRGPHDDVQDTRMVSWADRIGGVAVFHDDRRSVTCWTHEQGLYCMPDAMIAIDGGAR